MRVTNETNSRNLLRDIERISERMQKAQLQVSSSKKLHRPSDDPSATSDVVRIQAETSEIGQYLENIATGRTRLDFADTVLDGVERMVERIRSLSLIATGNMSSASLYTTEITGLRDQILSAANSTYQGQFIFAGSESDSIPYVRQSNGSITYEGNSTDIKLQIGRTATLQTQIPGSDVFSGSVDIFSTIGDLMTAMNNGDKAAVMTEITKLERFSGILSEARSRVGGLVNVAQAVETELKRYELTHAAERMRLEDADLPTAITELTQSETALQAATAVGARISNISILEYLR